MTNSIIKQKKRDAWERKVTLAYMHIESAKRNCNIFQVEGTRVLERYKEWLEKNDMEPLMDLNQFK